MNSKRGQLICPGCHLNCHILCTCTALTLWSRLGERNGIFVFSHTLQTCGAELVWCNTNGSRCPSGVLVELWKKQMPTPIQALLAKAVPDGLRVFLPRPLLSSEVQLVNDKRGGVIFALHTVGLSYIASIQRGKCNALDCMRRKVTSWVSSTIFFQGLFLSLSWTHMRIRTVWVSIYMHAQPYKLQKNIQKNNNFLSYCCPYRLSPCLPSFLTNAPPSSSTLSTSTKTLNWLSVCREIASLRRTRARVSSHHVTVSKVHELNTVKAEAMN